MSGENAKLPKTRGNPMTNRSLFCLYMYVLCVCGKTQSSSKNNKHTHTHTTKQTRIDYCSILTGVISFYLFLVVW